ncbi:MAG: MBL fold metallo-hydrolase [Nitrososphaeraceae archaeon]
MKITVLGAAKEVGRSAFLVSSEKTNVLLDYGVLLKKEPQFPMHVKPRDIDAVVISHAHLDHSGFVPSLFLASSDIKVIATDPTIDLTHLLIEDMIKISGFYLPFEYIDLIKMQESSISLKYRKTHQVKDMQITLHESGHVLGGSSILAKNGNKKIFYTGDINTRGSKLLRPADLDFDEIDLIVMESTYSQSHQMPREQSEKKLIEFAHEIIDNGGTLFVPAFSVERAQEIACVFQSYNFPHKIVMDGMALKVNEIMLKYPTYLRDAQIFKKAVEDSEWIKGWKRRKNIVKEPCVIISPAGMLVGGTAVFYMENIMISDKNGIALVSYQGENTPGKILLDQKKFKLKGEYKKCLAQVKRFEFSGHNSRDELFEILDKIQGNPKVLTIHGDNNSCVKFAKEIREKYGYDAVAPEIGDVFEI